MFFVCALVTLFLHFLKGFLMVVPGARPSFRLLFTVLSWGAAFFAESQKETRMIILFGSDALYPYVS